MRLFRYISIILCILLIGFYIYKNSPHYQIIKGEIFGTVYNIKIQTDDKDEALPQKIKDRLGEIDMAMSVFKKESEISKINGAKAYKAVELSGEMSKVLKAAAEVYKKSDGNFDPTLGPLIDLWGFGPHGIAQEPSVREIKKALKTVGYNKLKFARGFKTVSKSDPNTSLNLSAIAKGYGVDEIALLLDEAGYGNYVVEIGGEIKAKGYRSPEGEAWNVGLKKPSGDLSENALILSLSNIAVATSGNYRNFYEKDGQVIAHTISSKTGYPVETDILSASVFHDSCMYADAYATAILAMGLEKGLAFADKYGLKVIVFDKDLKKHMSKSARKLFME